MALHRGAMGLSAVVIVVFPDHTHLKVFTCKVPKPIELAPFMYFSVTTVNLCCFI